MKKHNLDLATISTILYSEDHAQVNLPALGDPVSSDFGIGTERRLGDAIMRDIRRDRDYLDDDAVQITRAALRTQAARDIDRR